MVERYLSRYAAHEVRLLPSLLDKLPDQWPRVVVIPAYRESPQFAAALLQHPADFLAILVVNEPEGAPAADNRALLDWLQANTQSLCSNGVLALRRAGEKTLLLVDRTGCNGLPSKTGVGLARKIGCDLALALHQHGRIHSAWIYSTDADAELPPDYFRLPEPQPLGKPLAWSAACLPFSHKPADSTPDALRIWQATRTYESAIRYYAQGLRYAGSPYGFVSLGSALAVSMAAYAKVRGFPQREAGEDFYLLNKLAKIGPIYQATGTEVMITSRLSDRVPFGTGPGVQQMCDLPTLNEACYYHPACFEALKHWLNLAQQLDTQPLPTLLEQLPQHSRAALTQLGIDTFAAHLKRQGQRQAQKALLDWFDGFRTLKFIRHLQAEQFPAARLTDCLAYRFH
jgi:hypothetical protein